VNQVTQKEQRRKYTTFSDLVPEVIHYHFHFILFVRIELLGPAQLMGGALGFTSWEEYQRTYGHILKPNTFILAKNAAIPTVEYQGLKLA
jgi:hypothetical protein